MNANPFVLCTEESAVFAFHQSRGRLPFTVSLREWKQTASLFCFSTSLGQVSPVESEQGAWKSQQFGSLTQKCPVGLDPGLEIVWERTTKSSWEIVQCKSVAAAGKMRNFPSVTNGATTLQGLRTIEDCWVNLALDPSSCSNTKYVIWLSERGHKCQLRLLHSDKVVQMNWFCVVRSTGLAIRSALIRCFTNSACNSKIIINVNKYVWQLHT